MQNSLGWPAAQIVLLLGTPFVNLFLPLLNLALQQLFQIFLLHQLAQLSLDRGSRSLHHQPKLLRTVFGAKLLHIDARRLAVGTEPHTAHQLIPETQRATGPLTNPQPFPPTPLRYIAAHTALTAPPELRPPP
jgi:hypothetical protein